MFEYSFGLENIAEVARNLLAIYPNQRIFLFEGKMGVGKTTFIKILCEQLGASNGLSSPTYSIVNEYQATKGTILYHFDLYRLNNEKELFDLGFSEYLNSGNYCFIEWPEIGLPFYEAALEVKISMKEEKRFLVCNYIAPK